MKRADTFGLHALFNMHEKTALSFVYTNSNKLYNGLFEKHESKILSEYSGGV